MFYPSIIFLELAESLSGSGGLTQLLMGKGEVHPKKVGSLLEGQTHSHFGANQRYQLTYEEGF